MSELYDLPNGWQWKKLDECTDKIIDGNYGESYPTKDEFIDSGIPFLTAAAIGVNGKIEYEKIKYISNEKHSILTKAQTTVGDVILVNRGVKNDFSNISSIIEDEYFKISNISPQLTKLKTNDLLKPKYLYYYFYSEPFLNQFVDLTMGSALRFISLTKTKKIEIPVPPLSEQQRIVSKLDLLFTKIDKSIELHQKNMDEADAFMGSVLNEVFGELDGQHKKEKLEKFDQKMSAGGTPLRTKNEYWENGTIEWFSSGELNQQFTLPAKERITDEGLKNSSAKLFSKGTLLIGMYDTAAMKMSILHTDGSCNQAIVGIKPNEDELNIFFLKYQLEYLKPKILEERQGVRQQNLNLSKIKNVEIEFPPLPIQQKVVVYLDSVSEKMEKVKTIQKEKMDSLKALKASILDKAFRGEL
ncbi:MAG: restriction endonuclease subunit S [Sulfuricurvum sp.]|nr:restriction endonuclease subunit S [Sulfuricurvum sp.]